MSSLFVTRTALMAEAKEAARETASTLMDEESFRSFYERTSRSVHSYLTRITDRNLADDLLQETYYRFYRAGTEYANEQHRRNSLFMIATNVARDAHRRKGGTTQMPLEDLVSEPQHQETHETRTDLTRALQQLKPQQRELLWLAYAQGASHDEIADIVGVTRGSVKSLLFRARKKLASLLGGEE